MSGDKLPSAPRPVWCWPVRMRKMKQQGHVMNLGTGKSQNNQQVCTGRIAGGFHNGS